MTPHTHRGRPVPYVAAWTSEDVYTFRPEPLVGGRLAAFNLGRPGEGEPILGKMQQARQRRCAVLGLCEVTGRKLGRHRWATTMGQHRVGGDSNLVLSMLPVTAAAMRLSLTHCPQLRRMKAAGELELVRVLASRPIVQLLKPSAFGPEGSGADFLADRQPPGPVVGYVKLEVLEHELVTPDEFLDRTS